jgi:hypothetical protein
VVGWTLWGDGRWRSLSERIGFTFKLFQLASRHLLGFVLFHAEETGVGHQQQKHPQ